MMTVSINIKADVDNITLFDLYELLRNYSSGKERNIEKIYEINGLKFKIETDVNRPTGSINYTITEIR